MDQAIDILDTISDRKATGQPFALATVVRTVAATAAKAGAKAVILPDGTISEGWIGGGCARAAVLKAAREALADGKPRLVSVQPPDALQEQGIPAGEERAGVRFAKNMCPSQGTMDVFVEPVLPHPEIVVCGSTPVAVAVAELGRRIGFAVTVCAPAADQASFAEADRRIDGYALPVDEAGMRFVVVATQGRGDEAALRAALAVEANYVAFVGSRKKAEALKAKLAQSGIDPAAAREAQGAGRARSRRHHAGRDRRLDPGRDRRRATRRPCARRRRIVLTIPARPQLIPRSTGPYSVGLMDLTTLFHPAVAAWFNRSFPAPTAAQAQAWPAIKAGRHVLVAAPTGSGKTLAAFLAAIDGLVRQGVEGPLANETQVVYVSPLKALSNDIQRNLEAPLAGIREALQAQGLPDVDIRTWVRTGDTPPGERDRMRRSPPHILVTTPESLYILLGSDSGRAMLATTRTVIVDEIHALAPNKRGSHLALSLERLAALCGDRLLRIGLSATQKPIEAVARFLVGAGADGEPSPACTIIDTGHRRARDLALEIPASPLEAGDVGRGLAAGLRPARRADRGASHHAHLRQYAPAGRARDPRSCRSASAKST